MTVFCEFVTKNTACRYLPLLQPDLPMEPIKIEDLWMPFYLAEPCAVAFRLPVWPSMAAD